MNPLSNPECRLNGASIFLSASVPEPERGFDRVPDVAYKVDQAVVSIARAIFIEGGSLVFGAHPSISPLVAKVVEHYYRPEAAEKPFERLHDGERIRWRNPTVKIYQSKVWKSYWAEVTERLARHPLVDIEWTEVIDDEHIDLSVSNRAQAPESMRTMRLEMLEKTNPVAMIAISGMDGILNEAELFSETFPGRPIYAYGTTGGASKQLAEKFANVHTVDNGALELVQNFWSKQDNDRQADDARDHLQVPYAYVASRIVEDIVKRILV